jgi:hypothetical protein
MGVRYGNCCGVGRPFSIASRLLPGDAFSVGFKTEVNI